MSGGPGKANPLDPPLPKGDSPTPRLLSTEETRSSSSPPLPKGGGGISSTGRILLTGFGGQGIVLAGHILGKAAAIYDGREATLIQAYGPEARGGATLVQVIISDEPILYPYIDSADAILCMSQEGFSKYGPALRPGGALLIEEDLVRLPDRQLTGRVFGIPATELAVEAGRKMVANIVMLGFLVAVTGVVGRAALESAIRSTVPKGTDELNLDAFARGFVHGELLLRERNLDPD